MHNTKFSDRDGVLFDKAQNTLVKHPIARVGSYDVPSSVTNIDNAAFYRCTGLTSVTVPNGTTSIGVAAFQDCTGLTSVTLPNSLSSVGGQAFYGCTGLTSIALPKSVTSVGDLAFYGCIRLTRITVDVLNPQYSDRDGVLFDKRQNTLIQHPIARVGSYEVPNSVTTIGDFAFTGCTELTSIALPNSVTGIGNYTFRDCTGLTTVYCAGNAPTLFAGVFDNASKAIVYYLPGTTGWGSTFGGRPTVLWNSRARTGDASFGVRTNRFGFPIAGTSSLIIVVEACTDLASPVWSPVGSKTLTGGSSYFSDPQWTNSSARFYRLRSR